MSLDISLFAITIAAVSFTPGLCMTVAFTLGMTVGYLRSLWMMLGELLGVATVFAITFWSLSWLLQQSPAWFSALSLVGGSYLLYLSLALFRAPRQSLDVLRSLSIGGLQLTTLGFVTAISNPKGWAFLIALLPGFINDQDSLYRQFGSMLLVMMITEFTSMSVYATSGKWMATKLGDSDMSTLIPKVAAGLLGVVGLWVFYNGATGIFATP